MKYYNLWFFLYLKPVQWPATNIFIPLKNIKKNHKHVFISCYASCEVKESKLYKMFILPQDIGKIV